MEWTDDGIVLSARKHGENSSIVTLLTLAHGRHLGLVRGGASRRQRGILQPGNTVQARWRARLSEHLGAFSVELTHAFAAGVLGDKARLAGLSAACAVAEGALPEREPHAPVFNALVAFLGAIEHDDWASAYVKWELGLLTELGFGLDLSACAATGANDQLVYVSPKSARAVSQAAGQPYRRKLLALPGFLLQPGAAGDAAEIIEGLRLTGYFLETNVFSSANTGLPAARDRLARRLASQPRDAMPAK